MKKLFLILISISLLSIGGCKKDDGKSSSNGITNEETVKSTLSGRVFDESGNPVNGALVSAGSKSSSTDQFGIFLLENVDLAKDRALVTITKPGFWNQIGSCHPSSGSAAYGEYTIFNAATTQSISSAVGGVITYPSGATVTFPSNAFITLSGSLYSGQVNVCMHTISAVDPKLGIKTPGSDLLAQNLAGNKGVLSSYGMIGIKLTDQNGIELKVANSKMAKLSFPISAIQQTIAPNTIPLWHFDEMTGLWKEEGSATKIGNSYQGDVAHFSWWNCDMFNNYALVSGKVLDCYGNPLPYALVVASSQGIGIGYDYCDVNGIYTGIIPSNVNVSIYAFDNSSGYNSQTLTLNYPASNVITYLPDLQIIDPNCNKSLTGTIVNCMSLPTPATVIFLDSIGNYLDAIYTPNGHFAKSLPLGFTRITAYRNNEYGYSSGFVVNTTITNVGNILLCNTISTQNNFQLTFTNSQIGTINTSYQVSGCDVGGLTPNSFIKFSDYNVNNGTISNIYLYLPSYLNGTYPWNSNNSNLIGKITINGQLYDVSGTSPGNGSTKITYAAPIGGQITGSFNGEVALSIGGITQLTGMLSTTFNIYRNK